MINESSITNNSSMSFISSSDASIAGMEHLDAEGGYASGPERELLTAVLFDGVQSYMNYFLADSKEVKNKYHEAYNWVHSQESGYVFSFCNVCEALGVNPDYLRLGLSNICTSRMEAFKKFRKVF